MSIQILYYESYAQNLRGSSWLKNLDINDHHFSFDVLHEKHLYQI